MKTSVEPDSKQLEQCIFPRMFIRDRLLFFRGEGGWTISKKKSCTAKTEKKLCKGSHREKNQASASTIITLIFLCLPTQKNYAQPKCEKKNFLPKKFPTLPLP